MSEGEERDFRPIVFLETIGSLLAPDGSSFRCVWRLKIDAERLALCRCFWNGQEFGAVGLLGAIGKDTLADAGQASAFPNEEWPKRWTLSFA